MTPPSGIPSSRRVRRLLDSARNDRNIVTRARESTGSPPTSEGTALPRDGGPRYDTPSARDVGWPGERRVYLTLDLECDFGTALTENVYGAAGHTDRLATLLDRHGVPLTTFVQTELLDERPESVEALRSCGSEVTFHPHSHTHARREATTSRHEISASTERFTDYFGEAPTGYRFPNGDVRPEDYRLLAAFDYEFDASVFPIWRPGHFNNVGSSTVPHYLADHDLFELPFTVYSETVRVPTALSYCRLLGRPFTALLTRYPPGMVVLNVHMHDLVTPESVRDLSPFYRAVYARNDHGFDLLSRLVGAFREAGYAFDTLDSAHEELRAGLP